MGWLPEDSDRKRLYLIASTGGVVIVLLLGLWWLLGSSSSPSGQFQAGNGSVGELESKVKAKDYEGIRQFARTSTDVRLASQAVYELSREPGPANISALQGFFVDPRPEVRAQAVLGFGRIAPRESYTYLDSLARTERDSQVKVALANSLGNMYAWRSLSSLLMLMDDSDERVRSAAATAFQKISFLRIDQATKTEPAYLVNDPPDARRRAIANLRVKVVNNPTLEAQYNDWVARQAGAKVKKS